MRREGVSLNLVRSIGTQVFEALAFLQVAPPPREARFRMRDAGGPSSAQSPPLRVLHCDLKPENIMLTSRATSRVKLIDFGLSARLGGAARTYTQSRFYRSPEVVLGLPYGHGVDVWSLGCVMAELYTVRGARAEGSRVCALAHTITTTQGVPVFPCTSSADLINRIFALVGLCAALPQYACHARLETVFHIAGVPSAGLIDTAANAGEPSRARAWPRCSSIAHMLQACTFRALPAPALKCAILRARGRWRVVGASQARMHARTLHRSGRGGGAPGEWTVSSSVREAATDPRYVRALDAAPNAERICGGAVRRLPFHRSIAGMLGRRRGFDATDDDCAAFVDLLVR